MDLFEMPRSPPPTTCCCSIGLVYVSVFSMLAGFVFWFDDAELTP